MSHSASTESCAAMMSCQRMRPMEGVPDSGRRWRRSERAALAPGGFTHSAASSQPRQSCAGGRRDGKRCRDIPPGLRLPSPLPHLHEGCATLGRQPDSRSGRASSHGCRRGGCNQKKQAG